MGAAFFLGRWTDPEQSQGCPPASISDDRLTTHAVVIGFTGSGKKAAAASLAVRQILTLGSDPVAGVLQEPTESDQEFQARASRLREEIQRSKEAEALGPLADQVEKDEDRVRRLEMRVGSNRSEASARTAETALSAGLGVLGGLFGSHRSLGGALSRTASKYRQADRAKDKAEADGSELEEARRDLEELKAKMEKARADLAQRMAGGVPETVTLTRTRSGVQVLGARLLWIER